MLHSHIPRLLLVLLLVSSCREADVPRPTLTVDRPFTLLPPAYTGIDFENRLTDTRDFNVFTYRNYYNGGGVGIGDVNGDGLADVYLTANQLPNRLYLNRGDFQFEDVTDAAAVAGKHAWATGVSMVDLNGDGLLDLYICNSGNLDGDSKANELYLNNGPDENGIPRFTEHAEAYGLADEGYGTHAAFFDYDRDGDLDLYLLNNSFRPASSFGLRNIRHIRDEKGGDKLMRNDGGRFVDVSEAAGIYGSEIGFGLGVTVGDVNGDGWPDVYVSNDFFERDYLYLNNQDGTFREALEAWMRHISLSSMGADMADLNNDARPDLFVTDMLPEGDRRLKTTSIFESWDVYQAKLRNDYYHQYMRNMLHVHNGDSGYVEIGQVAGVEATDWSWGALIVDLDGDGYKDLFVANGIYKDLTNQDFIDFFASEETLKMYVENSGFDFLELLKRIPSKPIPNYAFRNTGQAGPGRGPTFTNHTAEWGLDAPSFSNGSAYGDLDNDGDLDLVINNVNTEAFVYRNESHTHAPHRYLQVALDGEGMNRFGIGAQVRVYAGAETFYLEQMPMRGFQSSVDPVLTFGLGNRTQVDSVQVRWPDGRRSLVLAPTLDQRLTIAQAEATAAPPPAPIPTVPIFEDQTATVALPYTHTENAFVDFDREPFVPRMLSREGPYFATADVNRDGLEDLFIGGAKESPGQLLVQQADGSYRPTNTALFERDKISEDLGVAFVDVEGDGDPDLYVVSGGNEFSGMAPALRDRLYLNNGQGTFTKSTDRLPASYQSGAGIAAADYDRDGDVDLFIGGRLIPWQYGYAPKSTLLQNNGRGYFSDVTATLAPELVEPGMVTDAAWADVDGDQREDLVVVGEWMPVQVYQNTGGGRLTPMPNTGLDHTNGWWNRVVAQDLDGDGDVDLVAGNFGLNTQIRATPEAPATMHVHDFDRNGAVEQVISYYKSGKSYPMLLKNDLVNRLPFLKKRYVKFEDYAEQSVTDIFTPEELEGAEVRTAHTLASTVFINNGTAAGPRFTSTPLPFNAQLSPVYGILADDFDRDGHTDLLLTGNFHSVKPRIGRLDANYGVLLKGNAEGTFTAATPAESGLRVSGEVRTAGYLNHARLGRLILLTKNNEATQLLVTTR